MLIHCPTCGTSYDVKSTALGDTGRSVRCVRCRTVWFASARPQEAEEGGDPVRSRRSSQSPASEQDAIVADDIDMAAELQVNEEAEDHVEASPEAGEASMPDQHASAYGAEPVGAYEPLLDPGARALAMEPENPTLFDVDPPITMIDAPPIAPMEHDASMLPPEAPTLAGFADRVDRFANRRIVRPAMDARRVPLRIPSLQAIAIGLAAILVALIVWRSSIAALLPQTASLYAAIGMPVNPRGLTFEDVTASRGTNDGAAMIAIEGTIANVSRSAAEVPRLRFAVRNAAGNEVYVWTALPSRSVLGSGDQLRFRTLLASPPSDGRDIVVRFYNRRDAAGGLR